MHAGGRRSPPPDGMGRGGNMITAQIRPFGRLARPYWLCARGAGSGPPLAPRATRSGERAKPAHHAAATPLRPPQTPYRGAEPALSQDCGLGRTLGARAARAGPILLRGKRRVAISHCRRTLRRSNTEPAAHEYASRHGRCEKPQAGAACSDGRGTQRSRGSTPRDQARG